MKSFKARLKILFWERARPGAVFRAHAENLERTKRFQVAL